jgi:hypothetical protein
LITFKNEKQLAQQLPQTSDIYDLIYVIPAKITSEIEKMMRNCKNSYLVQIADGKTKIKGNKITLPSLKYLSDVS